MLVALHQPGTTLLHRAPAGPKLLVLTALGVAGVVWSGLPAAFALLAVSLLLCVVARVRVGAVLRATRSLLVLALVTAALGVWASGITRAAVTLIDLVAIALAAVVVSTTTPVGAMLDAIVRGLSPLRRVGLRPDLVALTTVLAIQSLPGTMALAHETRDAARARGLGRHPRAYLTPFVIRVVARAQETGDALTARGVLEAEEPD